MKESFKDKINSSTPLLVDFYAEWCGPCKMMPPILKEVKQTVGSKANIIKIDVDKNQKVAAKYGVRSVPTLVVFQNGEIKWRGSGVIQSSELSKILLQFA